MERIKEKAGQSKTKKAERGCIDRMYRRRNRIYRGQGRSEQAQSGQHRPAAELKTRNSKQRPSQQRVTELNKPQTVVPASG
jgi:hypothetical protein